MKLTARYILLFPFSVIYSLVTSARNWLYDKGICKSTTFPFSLITVGNLAVGGTGKTPHVEFILQWLKSNNIQTATLSRGYKRKTKGFIVADENSDSRQIGDEPFQIYKKNPKVIVAVDEKRVHGVTELLKLFPQLQAIVLDDAYQHRQIQAGLSILLTDYSNLYLDDSQLPGGNLRERKSGYKRADIIIVTKCPEHMTDIDIRLISKRFRLEPHQSLFFSSYQYGNLKPVFEKNEDTDITAGGGVLLVSGIANPQPLKERLEADYQELQTIFFPDHYNFQPKDYQQIEQSFKKLNATEKKIITTEKDAARLESDPAFPEQLKSFVYALPIEVKILNNEEDILKDKIIRYVRENSRNSRLS